MTTVLSQLHKNYTVHLFMISFTSYQLSWEERLNMLVRSIILLSLVLSSFCFVSALEITNVRVARDGQKQRIVIDFDGQKEPSFYIKKSKGEISITVEANLNPQRALEFKKVLQKTRYIDDANFTILSKEGETIITLLTNPKEKVADEIFSLPSPARVVIDLEKAQY